MATDCTIELKINVPDITNVKWNDVHKNITKQIVDGTLGGGVFTDGVNGSNWDQINIDKFKAQVGPAAAKFDEGEKFGQDIKNAREELKKELADNANGVQKTSGEQLEAYKKHDNALKTANNELFFGGRSKKRSKRGGSKRRGSKRRGSKRRGSKRRKH